MKRGTVFFSLVAIFVLLLAILSGCMKLLNLQIPDGTYVVGEWNNWIPTQEYKMTYSIAENSYVFNLPISSVNWKPSRSGNEYSIAWYKIIYKQGSTTKVSNGIPIWKENIPPNETEITIYASTTIMENGKAIGVGDSEKISALRSKWYVGGEFNNWNLQNGEMVWDEDQKVFKYELNNFNATKKSYKFKVTRNVEGWKPWEFNYDGIKYDAGFDNATLNLSRTGIVNITITFNPLTSIISVKVD